MAIPDFNNVCTCEECVQYRAFIRATPSDPGQPPGVYTPLSKEKEAMAYNPAGASVGTAVSNVLNRNKVAAAAAAYLEAGRIANNQASKLLSKGLPMMIRGYADTPAGRLVVANLAQAAFAQFRPQEPKLTKLGVAMTTAAMQELLQTVDVEGFIDSMLNSDATKKAIAALPADQD